jgi:flavin reductase (DIM6/NTAB) family NADH-FMN oxidoreductase RutF/rubredoxin
MEELMDLKALYSLSYGIYVLTAKENGFDNGCIINTAVQVASDPLKISISVNKANKTCKMIENTGVFNITALDDSVPFELISRFGMQSGETTNKFDGFRLAFPADNGVKYIVDHGVMYLSCKVTESLDLGSHMLFVAEVTDALTLSDEPPCTYAHYHAAIKPKPAAKAPENGKKQWVCTVCGYVYEGEELPDDFICPLCKHGKEDFELR